MKVRDLIAKLSERDMDDYVVIRIESGEELVPRYHLIIQDVDTTEPWHAGPRPIVNIVAHATNRQLMKL